jgi:phosphate-selective porin OprO/OprP
MAQFEERLRALQEQNQRLQQQYDLLSRQYQASRPAPAKPKAEAEGTASLRDPESFLRAPAEPTAGAERTASQTRRVGAGETGGLVVEEGAAAPSVLWENYMEKRTEYRPDMPPVEYEGGLSFRDGLEFRTKDGFFSVVFHNLTQLDLRLFDPTGDPLHNSFEIPRQRWYFQGNVTPNATFYTVINRGYGSLDVLDSWVDYAFAPEYKEQLQFRIGRMKTPYTYEYIKVSESDLIAPERSLFVGNLAPNRQLGVMAHGRLFDRELEYYLGVFNGPRRSFEDHNNDKDVFAFLNWRPFLHTGPDWLKQLNLSGSVNWGDEHDPAQPFALRTANDQSTSAGAVNTSPTFFVFKNNVFEDGSRMQWSGDVAYYYKSFTMLSGVQGGFANYALSGTPLASAEEFRLGTQAFAGVVGTRRTHVPMSGGSVALTYFLTGEQITRRVYLVEPIRPFGYYNGRLNPGAFEVYSRYSQLELGSSVFTAGLADPGAFSRRCDTIDTGVNWYLNHYVRFYFDWQHNMFNTPVLISNGVSTKHEELFWFRTQLFF